jgi:hypothetical protein
MDAVLQSQTVFHATGNKPKAPLDSLETLDLRPALLARYRDLTRLRYDFPLILTDEPHDDHVRSLSDAVDDLLRAVAPAGIEGEGLRKHVLRIEREIRRLLAGGATGSLSSLWTEAVAQLTVGATVPIAEVLHHAGDALTIDGELIDCDAATARRLITHAWRRRHETVCRKARRDLNGLIVRLGDILRAEFVRSEAGRRPESLRASVGDRHQGLFDFDVLARVLTPPARGERLTAPRRRRIEASLAILRGQRIFPAAPGEVRPPDGPEPYSYIFESSNAVLETLRERLPAMAALVKAIAIAELEADGRYVEATHDPFFESYDESSLGPDDLEQFPAFLLCLDGSHDAPAQHAALIELLSSGIPVKVLVDSDDLIEESSLARGHHALGARTLQLATMATALEETFVLQSTSSNLYALRDRISAGLAWRKSTLFSVYSGRAGSARLPLYLISAAAMQSRAFPAFTYDPGAGPELAARFSLENNPDPDSDWSVTPFEYADRDLTRHREALAYTLADFVLADRRHAAHYARVPPDAWNGHLLPVADWLERPAADRQDKVPCVLAVDDSDGLQKLVVDEKLVQAVQRCRDAWHRLQEFGGVHNSYAQQAIARERAVWEAERDREREGAAATEDAALRSASVVEVVAEPAGESMETAASVAPQRSPHDAWIETSRCSSCNECTQINDRMFAYNENKQAYIRDVSAGTYRQLVEAAESCQLSIIHPGKPRDPGEPGLDDLLERAQPFL